jgi:hypothetical protein
MQRDKMVPSFWQPSAVSDAGAKAAAKQSGLNFGPVNRATKELKIGKRKKRKVGRGKMYAFRVPNACATPKKQYY